MGMPKFFAFDIIIPSWNTDFESLWTACEHDARKPKIATLFLCPAQRIIFVSHAPASCNLRGG
jgi:hypothetical protein